MRMYKITACLLLCIASFRVCAQSLTYSEYIDSVIEYNQAYRAEKLSLPISESMLKASRSIPNPSVSVEYGNNSDWAIAMGQTLDVGLSQTITPGVTAAKKRVAKSELDMVGTALDEYLLNLKTEATKVFIDALLARDLLSVALQNMANMRSLAYGDSLRYAKGDISQLDMMQTSIESKIASQEYGEALADYRNALLALDSYVGNPRRGTKSVDGTLVCVDMSLSMAELRETALQSRPDLRSSQQAVALAENQKRLARRERIPEFELSLGVSLNSRVRNEEAPAPEYVGYSAGLSLPIPFSSANKGNMRAAQLTVQQAELQSEAAVAQAETEIMQAYNNYILAKQNAQTYTAQLIADAETILNGRMYAYQRGETSLVEVLAAQQTYGEVRKSYAEALHRCMTALVELQKSVGRIDITL